MDFKQINGASVLIRERGVFKVCDLFENKGICHVKIKGGYVRLYQDRTTSYKNMWWDEISGARTKKAEKFNYLKVLK